MRKAIVHIEVIDEQDFAYNAQGKPHTVDGKEAMTPSEIVNVLKQLDPEDFDDVLSGMYNEWARRTHRAG